MSTGQFLVQEAGYTKCNSLTWGSCWRVAAAPTPGWPAQKRKKRKKLEGFSAWWFSWQAQKTYGPRKGQYGSPVGHYTSSLAWPLAYGTAVQQLLSLPTPKRLCLQLEAFRNPPCCGLLLADLLAQQTPIFGAVGEHLAGLIGLLGYGYLH